MPNTKMETFLSSSLNPLSYQLQSQTMDTSINSFQASEYEEAESGMPFEHSLILLMISNV